ncbi:hypothetical protein Barb6_02338 [Bacteroidales bacterium Barb6]|nr:hypothetical protein Barb6_02338 [Bacteroidales bacterium Barb6]
MELSFSRKWILLLKHLQIIETLKNWYKFRRYFLSIYQGDADFFITECTKYFPNIYFHEHNRDTVGCILSKYPKRIIHYLSELNDKFIETQTSPYNRKDSLKRFYSICVFNIEASDEGSSGKKEKSKVKRRDSFDFTDKNGNICNVSCDLHLKLLKSDVGKISTDRRIYFHESIEHIASGKILVEHIGVHL